MTTIRNEVRFLLNDREERLSGVRSSDTLLDHLRLARAAARHQGGLRRGRLRRLHRAGRPAHGRRAGLRAGQRLHPAARLGRPLPRGDGRAPRRATATLHPVQQAMVDFHGSQCGFCTPGIVMSLYGALDAQARRRRRARSRRRCRATSAAAPATSRSSPPRKAVGGGVAGRRSAARRARRRCSARLRGARRRRAGRHPDAARTG